MTILMVNSGLKGLGNILEKKTMRNITPAIIFSKLQKRKVKINVVFTSHVLLICLKLC